MSSTKVSTRFEWILDRNEWIASVENGVGGNKSSDTQHPMPLRLQHHHLHHNDWEWYRNLQRFGLVSLAESMFSMRGASHPISWRTRDCARMQAIEINLSANQSNNMKLVSLRGTMHRNISFVMIVKWNLFGMSFRKRGHPKDSFPRRKTTGYIIVIHQSTSGLFIFFKFRIAWFMCIVVYLFGNEAWHWQQQQNCKSMHSYIENNVQWCVHVFPTLPHLPTQVAYSSLKCIQNVILSYMLMSLLCPHH